VAGKRADAFATAAAELQTVLGDLHDAVVALAWLRERTAGLRPKAAFVAGMLAEREIALTDQRKLEWRPVWRKLARKKLRGWMTAS
jgi:CHAD domain-containing protein